MRAFEVYINEERACLAGIGENGVLTAIVSWVSNDQPQDRFEIGALNGLSRRHVSWGTFALNVGDEIRVKLVDVDLDAVDEPSSVGPKD
jgi:hypothetical protein